jgi:hypothetical protein
MATYTTPTGTDVATFLSNRCGITVSGSDATIVAAVDAALEELSLLTGYSPFIAGSASTIVLDIPYGGNVRRIELPNGLLGSVTVQYNGSTLTAGTHYTLKKAAMTNTKAPAEYIELFAGYSTMRAGLSINGQWGYCLSSDVPAAIFEAVVMYAAGTVLDAQNQGRILGSGLRWTDGDVSESYSDILSGGGSNLSKALQGGTHMKTQAANVMRASRRVIGMV